MKRFSMMYGDYHNPIDNPEVLEKINGQIYEEDFLDLKEKDFIYYIFDNLEKDLVGFCVGQKWESFPLFNEVDPIIYIQRLEVLNKYQKQGFTQVLLDKVTERAKKEKAPFVGLYSVDTHTKTYWKNDFLSYWDKDNMFKIVDPNIKAFAVLFREALNTSIKNKSTIIEELYDIIHNEKFDNMLEYNIISENIYKKGYTARNTYKKISKKLDYLFFEHPLTPILAKDLQEKLNFNDYNLKNVYKELELCLGGYNISDSKKYIEKIRLIYASMFLLEADHQVCKDLPKKY